MVQDVHYRDPRALRLLPRSFYLLLWISVFACFVLSGRLYLTRSWSYLHIVWNVFLAWIPYGCALFMQYVHYHHPRRWWKLGLLGLLWLLFLPNALYMVTEFVHLLEIPSFAVWYDIGMLTVFAWLGCFLAVVSLRVVQQLVAATIGTGLSRLFVLIVAGLCGLGVYIGRFLRWNSWDVVLHPYAVMSDVLLRLINPSTCPRAYGVTLLFAALLMVCYLTFTINTDSGRAANGS